jgi:hypothetical protein
MKNNKTKKNEKGKSEVKSKESKALALHYMKTLTDVARESFIILDSDMRVLSGNPIFYKTFQVSATQTENKIFFSLGNGQWDIPELKRLLKNILPKKKMVTDFEVRHTFPTIGKKIIQLNAKQIDSVKLIIVAMEDITARKELEAKLAGYTKGLAIKVAEQTSELTGRIKALQALNNTMIGRELKMVELKKQIRDVEKSGKKSNGKTEKNSRQGKS